MCFDGMQIMGCILFLCLCFKCQSLNYCGQKYFLIKMFYNVFDFKSYLSESSMEVKQHSAGVLLFSRGFNEANRYQHAKF